MKRNLKQYTRCTTAKDKARIAEVNQSLKVNHIWSLPWQWHRQVGDTTPQKTPFTVFLCQSFQMAVGMN